jgi:hypothetical protein
MLQKNRFIDIQSSKLVCMLTIQEEKEQKNSRKLFERQKNVVCN